MYRMTEDRESVCTCIEIVFLKGWPSSSKTLRIGWCTNPLTFPVYVPLVYVNCALVCVCDTEIATWRMFYPAHEDTD
jgi:hypothetical protein